MVVAGDGGAREANVSEVDRQPADDLGAVGTGLPRILELARRHLGMDVAFLAEFQDGRQVYRGLAGDAASFGMAVQDGRPLSDTYCRLMSDGVVPNAIPDAAAHPAVRDLNVTSEAGIGSYVGVPVRLANGSQYGSLCTVSHAAHPVDSKDARFLNLLAEMAATEIQADQERAAERARIHELIVHERVQVALQPIVAMDGGRLVGLEALSRFPAGSGRPDQVFGAAHAVGLGHQVERLAAGRALEWLDRTGPDTYLAINLSPSVAADITGRLSADGLPLERVVVEITEHAAVENYAALRDDLAAVRSAGLRLAIDDAGAGYASLLHIVELSPDIIKIDRSLIHGVSADPPRRSVVRALVALASDMGAAVVGEGVEEQADLEAAGLLGVDAVQGYLVARPSTDPVDVAGWVARGRWAGKTS